MGNTLLWGALASASRETADGIVPCVRCCREHAVGRVGVRYGDEIQTAASEVLTARGCHQDGSFAHGDLQYAAVSRQEALH